MNLQTPDTYPALFWGYFLIWTLLALYVLYLGVKCSRLERTVRSLSGHSLSGAPTRDTPSSRES
ncbi:MAG: CcmD family protein [Bdellovibrionota bacterium]